MLTTSSRKWLECSVWILKKQIISKQNAPAMGGGASDFFSWQTFLYYGINNNSLHSKLLYSTCFPDSNVFITLSCSLFSILNTTGSACPTTRSLGNRLTFESKSKKAILYSKSAINKGIGHVIIYQYNLYYNHNHLNWVLSSAHK